MAYEQIFGRENIGGTGASFSNTDLTNPGKKKPVKVKEESVTPVQTITKNSPEFFKPSYAQSYKAGHVMPTVSQDLDGNHFDPIPYEALDEVVISNKPQNPVVAGPKTQEQATDYGADTSYKYAPRFNRPVDNFKAYLIEQNLLKSKQKSTKRVDRLLFQTGIKIRGLLNPTKISLG